MNVKGVCKAKLADFQESESSQVENKTNSQDVEFHYFCVWVFIWQTEFRNFR